MSFTTGRIMHLRSLSVAKIAFRGPICHRHGSTRRACRAAALPAISQQASRLTSFQHLSAGYMLADHTPSGTFAQLPFRPSFISCMSCIRFVLDLSYIPTTVSPDPSLDVRTDVGISRGDSILIRPP